MRVILITLVILTLLFSSASAIQRVKDTWDFGVRAGFTLTEHHGCDDCEEDMKTGFTGGFFAEYKASPNFSVQPEFLFVMKGWGIANDNMNLNYLEFPVLFKLKIAGSAGFTPAFYAGPAGAILTSASKNGLDYDQLFKSLDFGFTFGIGADFVAGTGKIIIDARYTLGLTDIIDNRELWELAYPWTEVPVMKNSALSFSIGFGW
ncbi:MAG: PorT family protein [Candidatus Zixiibacteriota bacterium]|nr:MAG: PorT family protein [candidate division Zixibacteria bacterium]